MSDSITKQDVQDVIDFAQAIAAVSGEYGMYSPMMSNQLLQGLNNNPRIPTLESIQDALGKYKEDAGTLQSYMDFMIWCLSALCIAMLMCWLLICL